MTTTMILKVSQLSIHGGQLNFHAGPVVWIDCEMTGLNPKHDKLLEIAVIITNGNLDPVDDGIEFVIKRDRSILDKYVRFHFHALSVQFTSTSMEEWCIEQHGKSGLTQACLESSHSKDDVSSAVLEYIKRWIPEKRAGVLAGNSVHADRSFLAEEMPEVVDWLHYRIIGKHLAPLTLQQALIRKSDVSSIKELCRRWYPGTEAPSKIFSGKHRALEDIKSSIRELAWYRENIFRAP
ncbi:ribonuclease H-like domain-containing protein [Boletus coccyginus]|nr:ribonuclease H-like domain-containing protein [Boletus coccyginus]